MPVTFMLCADNDRGPSTALAGLYPMLKAAGVKTEVHIYASGGHGFGINPETRSQSPVATTWQLRLGDWLKDIGMLKVD
jgi:endo-1,4-beta-xylanase